MKTINKLAFFIVFAIMSLTVLSKAGSAHCLELPFVFNNIGLWEQITGAGKDTYVLEDKMSQAWINFARNGDPNHAGLPKWQPYTEENGTTMFFDNKCIIRHHHDKELLKVTAEE